MYCIALLSIAAAALVAASPAPDPAAPYPIAQSTFGPVQESMINNDRQNLLASATGAAFSKVYHEFATATAEAVVEIVREYRGNPNNLAEELFTATATPTWYSALPSDIQQYVSALAASQAAVVSHDAGLSVSEPPMTTAGGDTQGSGSSSSSAAAAERSAGVMGAMAAVGAMGIALL